MSLVSRLRSGLKFKSAFNGNRLCTTVIQKSGGFGIVRGKHGFLPVGGLANGEGKHLRLICFANHWLQLFDPGRHVPCVRV
jgi:hypothetical protein